MTAKPVSVLVSCGSNIDPERNLRAAIEQLASLCSVDAESRIFVTRSVGATGTPDFRNAAVELTTQLSAAKLKYAVMRDIESLLGRRRTEDRNAPRSIDLDLSLFGDDVIQNEPLALSIPDPDILTLVHVALPLAEIAPDRRHPVSGETLGSIARRLLAAAEPGQIRPLHNR